MKQPDLHPDIESSAFVLHAGAGSPLDHLMPEGDHDFLAAQDPRSDAKADAGGGYGSNTSLQVFRRLPGEDLNPIILCPVPWLK